MSGKIEQRHREAAASYMDKAGWSADAAKATRSGLRDSPKRSSGTSKAFGTGFSPEHELIMTFVQFENGDFGELSHDRD